MPDPFIVTFRAPPLPYFIDSNRVTYAPGEEHPSRVNMGVFDLLVVREGALHIGEDKQSWTVEPGQALILRPDKRHYSIRPCRERTTFDWVHFQAAGAWEETGGSREATLRGDHYTYAIRLPKMMTLSSFGRIGAALAELHEAAQSSTHAAFWSRQQRFLDLMRMLEDDWRSDAAKAAVSVAERAAAYLKARFRFQVSNADLSAELGLHPNYIARCMTEVYGCTPQQYLLYYRLDQAKLLLLTTDWPIARVAEETGFRQTPHFSRLFAAHTGVPPHRFRKRFTE